MAPKRKRFFMIPFFILVALPLLGLIVMLLWNAILPDLLGVRHISFWQATGLLILCKILFGSFRPGGPGGFRGAGPPWKHKLMNMTPEDRERFKQEWQQRWTDPNKDKI
jgi:hypothetical protein